MLQFCSVSNYLSYTIFQINLRTVSLVFIVFVVIIVLLFVWPERNTAKRNKSYKARSD